MALHYVILRSSVIGIALTALLGSSSPMMAKSVLGQVDCHTWIADRAKEAAAKKDDFWPSITVNIHVRWLLGFISGVNVMSGGKRDLAVGIDGELVKDWMDGYCKKHPNASGAEAATELLVKLAK